ncbi:hypothetical protein ES706_01245 [subsurface metagenome]|nr:hypothetical protein [Hadesarchaea archaeon]
MKQHAAIVIAALMITSMAFAISTSAVNAAHEVTVSIDKGLVKDNTPMVLTIKVTNTGADAIENVRIIVPSDWSPAALIKVLKGDNVLLGDNTIAGDENNKVILPAGTIVEISAIDWIVPENTRVIILKGTEIFWYPVGDVWITAELLENLEAKMQKSKTFTSESVTENFEAAEDTSAELENTTGTRVRLVANTLVVLTGEENVVMLPEDTLVQLITDIGLVELSGENVKTIGELNITGFLDNCDNFEAPSGDNFIALSKATTNSIYTVQPGDENIAVCTGDGGVVIPPGEVLQVTSGSATLFAGENVIREANENVTVENIDAAENQPNWKQDNGPSTLPSGTYVEWVGDENNQIASGEPLEFPFALTTPTEGREYTIYVKTTDTKGAVEQTTITLTVDNAAPKIEVSVSPELVGANRVVTITVTSNEPLTGIENVLVIEKGAPENTAATFKSVSADKKTWDYTYTTGENAERDGTANVYVVNAEDLAGLENDGGGTFIVDRVVPLTPEIAGFPTTPTNVGTWLLEGIAQDNKDPADAENIAEGMVKVRIGTTVYEVTTDTNGYWSKSIKLTEGTQEVGVRCVDLAGNEGSENAENITYDATAPSITWGNITGVGYTKDLEDDVRINDPTPTITLTIRDAVLGIDNSPCDCEVDNTGYTVKILNENLMDNDELTNALVHDNHVLQFENTLATALDDGTYYVNVLAGDNLQTENALIKFVIDTDLPSAPTINDAYVIVSTMDSPVVVKDASRTIVGTAEAGAKITVYGTVDTTEKVLATTTAESQWTATFTLTAGSTTKIEVSATDEAGNESASRELYGWMLADASAPTVTLAEVSDTTDKTSITISGTVTKDAWEDWSEITLTVQVGTGSVEVPCVGGSYSYSLALSEGPNTIIVQATDGIGNPSDVAHATVERTVTPWSIYAIILVIVALILAAIAIFGGPRIWKR